MGQYFILTNIDKRQVILPWNIHGSFMSFDQFATGAKFVEQLLNVGKKPMLALSLLSIKPIDSEDYMPPSNPMIGSWAGDRIVLVGDSFEVPPSSMTPIEVDELKSHQKDLYQFAEDTYEKLNYLAFLENNAALKPYITQGGLIQNPHHLIVNRDHQEYLDPAVFHPGKVSIDAWAMDADGILKGLYSLLFWPAGLGGDAEDRDWAGCHLEIVEKSQVEDEISGWTNVSQETMDKLENFLLDY